MQFKYLLLCMLLLSCKSLGHQKVELQGRVVKIGHEHENLIAIETADNRIFVVNKESSIDISKVGPGYHYIKGELYIPQDAANYFVQDGIITIKKIK